MTDYWLPITFIFMADILTRRNTVLEALRGSRRELHQLWLQEGLDKKTHNVFVQAARGRRVPVQTASKQKLGQLADRKSTRLNSSHYSRARMPSSA